MARVDMLLCNVDANTLQKLKDLIPIPLTDSFLQKTFYEPPPYFLRHVVDLDFLFCNRLIDQMVGFWKVEKKYTIHHLTQIVILIVIVIVVKQQTHVKAMGIRFQT